MDQREELTLLWPIGAYNKYRSGGDVVARPGATPGLPNHCNLLVKYSLTASGIAMSQLVLEMWRLRLKKYTDSW